MATDYLLTEDGFKILLEDGSGALIIDVAAAPTDDGHRKIITLREDGIHVVLG